MIEENTELNIKNLLCFRGNITQNEMQSTIDDMTKFIYQNNLKIAGPKITTTYSVSQAMVPTMDLEILIPIDKPFQETEKYKFKPELKIVNALKSVHKGNPQFFNNTIIELQTYISDKKLMPISSLYVISVNEVKNPEESENFCAELFISINPNKF